MTSGAGSRRDHDRFCRREGWDVVTDARGRPTGHHITYRLRLTDGRILRTRISRPAHGTQYGPRLWSHILTDQLDVTEGEFWDCVSKHVTPRRGGPVPGPPTRALPASLVHQLLAIGTPEADVAAMTLNEAVAAMTAHWSGQHPPGQDIAEPTDP